MDPKIIWRVWGYRINPVKSTDQADFCKQPVNPLQRASLVGTVTRLRAGRRVFMMQFPAGARFSLLQNTHNRSRAHPQSVLGLFPALKLPGRKPQHSLPSSAEVKNKWRCTTNVLHSFMT